MTNIHRKFVPALGAVALLPASPALSQAWIGQVVGDMMAQQAAAAQEQACMTGTAMPPNEIEETRPTAYAAITGYWTAVRRGGAVDVTSMFAADTKASWTSPTASVKAAGLAKVTDPFAGTGAALDAQPIAFVRSGDGRWVRAQWGVRSGGKLTGTYDGLFKRVGATWKLHKLTLIPATAYAEPVVQFCHKPNDVLPYRLSSSDMMRGYTAKQSVKARAKADKAKADADKAAGSTLASEKRARADAMEAKAVAAANAARLAVEANEQAKADAAAAEAAKAKAIAALANG